MSNQPKFGVRIKSVARYHYRGTLYKRRDQFGNVITHAVDRDTRDHLIASGYFEDVRSEEPVPLEPVAIPAPQPLGNDMSNESITGRKGKTYGAKSQAVEV